MHKYKICVYAISKNESKNVDRWVNSMKEADEIYVLDTGSNDDTVKLLKEKGVHVFSKIINPWRFDVARNESLKLVPEDTDIYVCTDLDEIFLPGWREKIENAWNDDTTALHYTYNWSLDKNNNPTLSFYYNKIHNKDYKWIYPVHEVLKYVGKKEETYAEDKSIILNHYPEFKSERSSYLPLLKIAVEENPEDSRSYYLLGREYVVYENNHECIDILQKYLGLKSATYYVERGAAMRYIARSYKRLGNYNMARIWYEKALVETPTLRDAYVEYGMMEYDLKNYYNAIIYLERAANIKENSLDVVNEIFAWDDTLYKLLAESYFSTGDLKSALYYAVVAVSLCNDNRNIELKNNIERKIIEVNKCV